MRLRPCLTLVALAACASRGIAATDAQLAACRDIADRTARLACYDELMPPPAAAPALPAPSAVPPAVATSPAPAAPPAPAAAAAPTVPLVAIAAAAAAAKHPQSVAGAHTTSSLSKFWELDAGDKEGPFHVKSYLPNYVLPLNWSTRVNQRPESPTHPQASVPEYRHLESIVQLSLRAKVAEGLLLPNADLWFAYTNRAQWQVWTPESSRPFRNTDYEPELIYVVPVPERFQALPGGWRWRMLTLGAAHQSNGQADPLSRSWNRVTLGTALERGEFGLQAQVWRRIHEPLESDDNPDLTSYIGRGEIRGSWQPGRSIASVAWRTNFKQFNRGSLQLDWTYPIFEDTQGLRMYVRAFHGYGESLLDYNFRKTTLGVGVMMFAF